MQISFIIITDSKKYKECCLQIKSIKYQNIPNYEIIIAGNISQDLVSFLNNIDVPYSFLNMEQEASSGKLGAMRNEACKVAKYDNLVISDDDMLFTKDWYTNLKLNTNFDILTTRVKLPDGTRFWDHCCYMSPTRGHIILNPNEDDDHLYMSGGQSWIMKKHVFEAFQWNENMQIYNMSNLEDYSKGRHNEDTEYSLRCRSQFKINHDHNTVVYHNDPSYTSYGRVVRRRYNKASFRWSQGILLPHQQLFEIANLLLSKGLEAEAVDIFRKLYIETGNEQVKKILEDIDNQLGGSLEDSVFSFENKEYTDLVQDV